MGIWQDFMYIVAKRIVEKRMFKKEQVDYLLFILDDELHSFYREKMTEQEKLHAEKIAQLEGKIDLQQKNYQVLKENIQTKELDALQDRKKAEILDNENKMLKHQIDEMDYVTRKTLNHIKTNIYIGKDVVQTLSDGFRQPNANQLESSRYLTENEHGQKSNTGKMKTDVVVDRMMNEGRFPTVSDTDVMKRTEESMRSKIIKDVSGYINYKQL